MAETMDRLGRQMEVAARAANAHRGRKEAALEAEERRRRKRHA
jgi:hypothetical protein